MLPFVVVDSEYHDGCMEETPLDELLITERDECISENLEKFIREHLNVDKNTYVAVIFGGKHMRSIHRCLKDLGFAPKTKKWFEMIRTEACEV